MASNHRYPYSPHRPPPPPPPRPNVNNGATPIDNMGSLYPPPPPPPQSNVVQYHHHQPTTTMQSTTQSAPQHRQPMPHYSYQQQQQQQQQSNNNNLTSNSQYQHYQQPGQQQQQQQQPMPQYQYYRQMPQHQQRQQPQYSQYSTQPSQYATNNNYATAVRPPPPPPPRQSAQQHHNNNNHQRSNDNNLGRHNNAHGANNANVAAAESLRNALPTSTSIAATPTATAAVAHDAKIINKPKKINPKMVKKYSGRGLKTISVCGPGMPTQRFKICVGNHPEDLEKWIAERKKRFPRVDGSHLLNKKKRSRDNDEDAQGNDIAPKRTKEDEAGEKGGLSTLLGGYASSSSEDDGAPPKSKDTLEGADNSTKCPAAPDTTATTSQDDNPPKPKRICRFYQRGKCRHGESCTFLHSDAAVVTSRQSQSERDKARNMHERELQVLGLATTSHGSRYNSGGKVIDNTSLLQKLLQRDKERERRMTLQLLRYIVDCDYFQSGNTTSESCGEVDGDGAKEA